MTGLPEVPLRDRARDDVRDHRQDQGEVAAPALPPLLPRGEYTVQSSRAEIVRVFKRRELVLHVEVLGSPHDGAYLFWCAPLPPNGRRPGISAKFSRAWILAAGRRTRRGERLSLTMLEGKRFRARVETVTTDFKGAPLPPEAQYSIVRELLERLA